MLNSFPNDLDTNAVTLDSPLQLLMFSIARSYVNEFTIVAFADDQHILIATNTTDTSFAYSGDFFPYLAWVNSTAIEIKPTNPLRQESTNIMNFS